MPHKKVNDTTIQVTLNTICCVVTKARVKKTIGNSLMVTNGSYSRPITKRYPHYTLNALVTTYNVK